jgi:hypothetical protein
MLRSAAAVTAAIALSLVVASSATAQIIYEPVQYQYNHPGGFTYYYGGSDPLQHAYAKHVACRNGYPSEHTFNGLSGLHQTIGQIGEKHVVLTDCLPLRNAAVYGYRVEDAVNEANASVPRFFRKADLIAAARPAGDGTLVVPANLKPHAAHHDAPMQAVHTGEVKPRAIIILPKRAPRKTDDEETVKKVVAVAK